MSCKSLTSPDSRCKVSDPAKQALSFEESDDAAAEDVIGAETGELVVDVDPDDDGDVTVDVGDDGDVTVDVVGDVVVDADNDGDVVVDVGDDGDVTVDMVGDLVDADNDVVGDVVVDVGDDGDVTVDDDGVVAGDETGDESPKETIFVLLYAVGSHTPRSPLEITGVPLQSSEVYSIV